MEAPQTKKTQLPHPLAGRSGVGSPFAPAGWNWRCGYRIKDMYFRSPCGKNFRSQVQLNAFLDSQPGSPSPTQFRWTVRPTDYQDGSPLPGNPPGSNPIRRTPRRVPKDDATLTPTPTLVLCVQNDTAEIESTPRLRTFSRLDEDVEQDRRGNQLHEAHRGKRLFKEGPSPGDGNVQKRHRATPPDDPLEKLLREGASLQGKSPEEIAALKTLAESKSIAELQKCPEEALRVYYRLVRNEDPPASFGIGELSKLITSWVCKHKRAWCLQEQSYIFLLRSQREKPKDSHRKELESRVISGASCNREACCADPGFCSGCTCNLCKRPIESSSSYSSLIRCQNCLHFSHLECALAEKKAGVVPEKELDFEGLCETCGEKIDLVLFWKMMIKEGLAAAGDRYLLEQKLEVASRVAEGTKRVYFQPLLAKVKALRSSDPAKIPELVKALGEVVDSIGEYDDRLMDESVVNEILESGVKLELNQEEARATELQKKAEVDYSKWLGAEKLAETRRRLVEQMQVELKKAEGAAKARGESAAASRAEFQKAEKRVRLLKMLKKMNGISGQAVEVQRWNCEQEMEKVAAAEKRMNRANVERLPVLYGAYQAQEKRLRAAQGHLKQMSSLQKLLSSEASESESH